MLCIKHLPKTALKKSIQKLREGVGADIRAGESEAEQNLQAESQSKTHSPLS